ncbi:MAG TPA: MFS transporter [Saprospiraceae bacterium]|nr:MFS transporter [Saprospiraceae bacterium]HMQ81950.1 MFS transporter [Saprospiraceae bacterium]
MNTSSKPVLNDQRIIRAWAFFDWANSAFALVITAAIFPAYYMAVTDDEVRFLGIQTSDSALYAYAISFAYLLIALFSPLLSGIADYGGRRKFFLKFFTILGALSCLSLFFFKGMEQLTFGTVAFIFAMIGFAGGLVFYNAFLPIIVSEDLYDRVSAKGYAYGYFGSVLLLVLNLVMIQYPQWFGIPDAGLATRFAFLTVGLWWLGFALIPFRWLPSDEKQGKKPDLLKKGFQELKKVWRNVQYQPQIKSFLISFFCYSAGVQTVIYLAATFAEKELQFGTIELISVVLILQLVGIGGAYLFARLSEQKGNKLALISILFIWMGICLAAYFVDQKIQFYIVAGAVGLVMGGVQALSRSTYSKLLPEQSEDTTSYFSFYDVLEKVAVILGTFLFGFIDQLTGNMRLSILVLSIFFLAGILLLLRLKVQPAENHSQATISMR